MLIHKLVCIFVVNAIANTMVIFLFNKLRNGWYVKYGKTILEVLCKTAYLRGPWLFLSNFKGTFRWNKGFIKSVQGDYPLYENRGLPMTEIPRSCTVQYNSYSLRDKQDSNYAVEHLHKANPFCLFKSRRGRIFWPKNLEISWHLPLILSQQNS